MTDREKLVELLLKCEQVHERDLNDDWEDGEIEAIANHLIANGVTVNDDCKACAEATHECIVGLQEQITEMRKKLEWISVEDRLPEINVDVNICDSKNNVSTGCLSSRTTRERRLLWSTRHRGSKTDITHWLPLPEALKEEDHATEKYLLGKAPTLDVEPVRHGRWIDEIEQNAVTASGREVHVFRCSVCDFTWANKTAVLHYFRYCPNCGAKMDAKEE